jgi:hypothetical protein
MWDASEAERNASLTWGFLRHRWRFCSWRACGEGPKTPAIGAKFGWYHPAAEFGIAPASTRGLLRRFKSGSEVGAGPHLDRTEVGNETGSLDRRRAGFG